MNNVAKNTLRTTHKVRSTKYNWVRTYLDHGLSKDMKPRTSRMERRKAKQATNRFIMQENDHLDETVSVYQEGRNAFLAGYGYIANPYKKIDRRLANEWLSGWNDEEAEYAELYHCCPYHDR